MLIKATAERKPFVPLTAEIINSKTRFWGRLTLGFFLIVMLVGAAFVVFDLRTVLAGTIALKCALVCHAFFMMGFVFSLSIRLGITVGINKDEARWLAVARTVVPAVDEFLKEVSRQQRPITAEEMRWLKFDHGEAVEKHVDQTLGTLQY